MPLSKVVVIRLNVSNICLDSVNQSLSMIE